MGLPRREKRWEARRWLVCFVVPDGVDPTMESEGGREKESGAGKTSSRMKERERGRRRMRTGRGVGVRVTVEGEVEGDGGRGIEELWMRDCRRRTTREWARARVARRAV